VIRVYNEAGKFVETRERIGDFKRTPNVVLECPFEGNSTYILDKNWKRKVSRTKQYVREHYNYGKIVHKGEWLDRVRDSLRDL